VRFQDEDYYYRQQQPRNRYPAVQSQVPPSVPITGNGRPKSRVRMIFKPLFTLNFTKIIFYLFGCKSSNYLLNYMDKIYVFRNSPIFDKKNEDNLQMFLLL
jgi:hypothetical protein